MKPSVSTFLRAVWRERMHLGLAAIAALLLTALFHCAGNTVKNVPSRSVFVWMVARWHDPISYGADYSMGWLLPLVSLGIVWHRRREIAAAPKRVCVRGLGLIALGLALHWAGARVQQPRLSLLALVLLLWSIPLHVYGWATARLVAFPCAYLLFCIPMNFLDALTFPLRMFSTSVAAALLNGIGIAVRRSGTIVHAMEERGVDFNVADPCSGLRSLLAMMALVSAYAYLTQRTPARKWALFLLSIPIAMAGNTLRIVTVAVVGRFAGREMALRLYHDYSGYVVFAVCVSLMVTFGVALSRFRMEVMRAWMRGWVRRTEP